MTIVDHITFNPQKHKLGKLCPRQHDHCGSGQSIRPLKGSCCCYCAAENKKKCDAKRSLAKKQAQATADLLIPTNIVDAIEFNAEKHMMGSLCKNRHDY